MINLMLFISLLFTSLASADVFQNFFGQQMRQQQPSFDYQRMQLNSKCSKYLCPESFACVDKPLDCPCPFPDSQEKCILPDKSNYVCIAKVDRHDLDEFEGEIRDCKWVERAWNGV
ncbi:DEKNAAC100093 [Brettanomyces naardenensis]|uniref:Long chronological lifespan protein 2 n=1 Tax=Brettanomyces naardenensis TaxID=13370 RepID=A0A448YFA4_BRENA|nr:DEKNAAC100093 [Brettanomyces naardenensis]